jgi:hypothetical protein
VHLQARLRLADVVEKEDVNEAMRLMEMSKESLNPAQEHGRSVIHSFIIKFHDSVLRFGLLNHILLHSGCFVLLTGSIQDALALEIVAVNVFF